VYLYLESEDDSNQDTPNDFYMDNRSAVDMRITFKDTMNVLHIRCIFNFMKQGIEDTWHTLVWIRNQSMVAEGMPNVLAKKDLLHTTQYSVHMKQY
jgi:hypothetical protein